MCTCFSNVVNYSFSNLKPFHCLRYDIHFLSNSWTFFHLTLDLILSSLRRENKKPCYEINKIQRRYTYFIVFDLNTWKVHKKFLITQATKQKLFKLPKRLNNNYLITQATPCFHNDQNDRDGICNQLTRVIYYVTKDSST